MRPNHLAYVLWLAAGLTGAVFAADPAPAEGPGWTGLTNPADVISARQALMVEIERLLRPTDSFIAGDPADPAELKSAAGTIATMLAAVPHLFPPTTNLYDPAVTTPVTIALPQIWQNFPAFYQLAAVSAAAATAMSSLTGSEPEALRNAGRNLRATCDACHALHLRAYVPETVNSQDLDFDFDSVLKKN
jgi:cytochrome c556